MPLAGTILEKIHPHGSRQRQPIHCSRSVFHPELNKRVTFDTFFSSKCHIFHSKIILSVFLFILYTFKVAENPVLLENKENKNVQNDFVHTFLRFCHKTPFLSKSHVFDRKIIISSFKFIPGGLRGEGNTVFWGNRETMGTPIKTMDKMSISQNAE